MSNDLSDAKRSFHTDFKTVAEYVGAYRTIYLRSMKELMS